MVAGDVTGFARCLALDRATGIVDLQVSADPGEPNTPNPFDARFGRYLHSAWFVRFVYKGALDDDHEDQESKHQAFMQAIQEDIEWIVVDDRNLLKSERQFYLDQGIEAGYKSEVVVTSHFDDDAYGRYAKRNKHGLNRTKISELAETAEMPEKT